jgi:hypothetical protein
MTQVDPHIGNNIPVVGRCDICRVVVVVSKIGVSDAFIGSVGKETECAEGRCDGARMGTDTGSRQL